MCFSFLGFSNTWPELSCLVQMGWLVDSWGRREEVFRCAGKKVAHWLPKFDLWLGFCVLNIIARQKFIRRSLLLFIEGGKLGWRNLPVLSVCLAIFGQQKVGRSRGVTRVMVHTYVLGRKSAKSCVFLVEPQTLLHWDEQKHVSINQLEGPFIFHFIYWVYTLTFLWMGSGQGTTS